MKIRRNRRKEEETEKSEAEEVNLIIERKFLQHSL